MGSGYLDHDDIPYCSSCHHKLFGFKGHNVGLGASAGETDASKVKAETATAKSKPKESPKESKESKESKETGSSGSVAPVVAPAAVESAPVTPIIPTTAGKSDDKPKEKDSEKEKLSEKEKERGSEEPTPQANVAKSKPKMVFGTASPKCFICAKTVYKVSKYLHKQANTTTGVEY